MRTPLTVIAVLVVALLGLWFVTEDDDGGAPRPRRRAGGRDRRARRGAARPALRGAPAAGDRDARRGAPRRARGPRPQLPAEAAAGRRDRAQAARADRRRTPTCATSPARCSARASPATTTRATGACAWSSGAGTGKRVLDEMVLAHELTHALEDQHFGLESTTAADRRPLARRGGAGRGHRDRAHVRLRRATTSPPRRRSAACSARRSRTPATCRRSCEASVLFPYVGGERFVSELLRRAGGRWELVDTAYEVRPPASTEQILHPEAYFDADEPLPVRICGPAPSSAPAGSASSRGTWGELQTRELLGSARRGGRLGRRPLRAVAVGRRARADHALALGHAARRGRVRAAGARHAGRPRRGEPPGRARHARGGRRPAARASGWRRAREGRPRPPRAHGAGRRAPVRRPLPGRRARAAAVPGRRARLLVRGARRARAVLDDRLLDRAAAVRPALGPHRAAVADAGRAGAGRLRDRARRAPRPRTA